LNVEIIHEILPDPQNNVVDLNNVMTILCMQMSQ
jgi:hypothetical protein